MIAAVAVTAVHGRSDAVACCAALALHGAAGAGAPIVLIADGPHVRPALLASEKARAHEKAIHGLDLAGVRAAARGHLCLVSLPGGGAEEAIAAIESLAGTADPLVASVAPSDLEPWERQLTLVRADLPGDRDLLAVVADSLTGKTGVLRVDKRGPGWTGARRALAGLAPGRAPDARYRRLCRGIR